MIPLGSHAGNITIITSLAWSSLRDVLKKAQKEELISYIESIKITDTRITIKTGKPIVNNELSNYREVIRERIEESFRNFGIKKSERKIVFI